MKSARNILTAIILIIVAAPVVQAASEPLIDRPTVLQPTCKDALEPEVLLGAAWKTMESFGWKVLKAQPDHFLAQSCQSEPRSFCVQVDVFLVNDVIEVWEYPLMPPTRKKVHRMAQRWVESVQAAYGQEQCGEKEELVTAFEFLQQKDSPQWTMDEELETKFTQEGKFGRWFEWRDRFVASSPDSAP